MAESGDPGAGALQEALVHLFDPNVRVPPTPRLVDDLDVFDMPDGLGIQFRGGAFPVVIRGASAAGAWAYLREAMDGCTPIADLVVGAPATVGRTPVAKLLSLLHGKGLLMQDPERGIRSAADDAIGTAQSVFWGRHLGISGNASSGDELQTRLATSQVLLIGSGMFGDCVADLLRRTGVSRIKVLDAAPGPGAVLADSLDSLERLVDDAAGDVDLVVCAIVGASSGVPATVNRICCATDTRVLFAVTVESRMDLGPLVQPGESACYECVRLREQSMSSSAMENLLYRAHLEESDGSRRVVGEALPVATLYASLVVMEAIRVLTGIAAPTLLNHVTSVEGVRGSMCTNRVPRVPRCPTCSRASAHSTATEFA